MELIPYEDVHVLMYHQWLQDAHIQEMTATDPVSLDEEYKLQKEWACATDRFIKIIKAKETGRLVGDINVFFSKTDEPNADAAEINIMIADLTDRNKGYASEALMLTMAYAAQKFNVGHFFVKVLAKNRQALAFFRKHGFKDEGGVDAFGEVKLTLATDALPRTLLKIVPAHQHSLMI